MKNIIFIAPPAAGKGTMSSMLEEKYGYVHISTGDLLRDAKNKNDEIGEQIAVLIDHGIFVPDEIVLKLLSNRIKENDCKNGFILDGYPRNINQVDNLMKLFDGINVDNYIAIFLDIDYDKAMKRTLGRVSCLNCKASYNEYFEELKPKVENICDKCGGKLIKRLDDTADTFKIRFNTYLKETKPVVDYFESIHRLKRVEVNDDPINILSQIERIIEN